jgi:hypothetical protein
MGMFDRAKEMVGRAVDEGRDRADDLRRRRERARLMGELGEACYRQVKGDADAAAEIDRLVVGLDELEAAGGDEVEVDSTDTGEPAEMIAPDTEVEGTEPASSP